MKKTFKMYDLDCANCAARMENEIRKIDGVQSVSISFLAQKLTLEADDAHFDAIAQAAEKACKKIDDEVEVELK